MNEEVKRMNEAWEQELNAREPKTGDLSGTLNSLVGSESERLDEFMTLIKDHVNPTRVAAGVNQINEEDARSSFLLLEQFYSKWTKPNVTGETEQKRN